MDDNLEEKRKEILKLHESWLRPDVPLMRTPPVPSPTSNPDKDGNSATPSKKNWTIIVVIAVAILLIILELTFFASELGWLHL